MGCVGGFMQVLVSERVIEVVRERVAGLGLPVALIGVDAAGVPASDAGDAVALFWAAMPSEAYGRLLDSLPGVRWLHVPSAGVERFLLPSLRSRGVLVTNSADAYAVPVSEWVLHALLMVVKRAVGVLAAQQARVWQGDLVLDELAGRTLTVVGTGTIGRAVAQRASAFGMRVWGVNRGGRFVDGFERVVGWSSAGDVFRGSDFLVLALPFTARTQGLFGRSELAALPGHCWVVNVGRGQVVDESALIAALCSGAIGGAVLDVFAEEPLPPTSVLWGLPNVVVVPHLAGSSPQTMGRIVDGFVRNLGLFVSGAPLVNVVDVDEGY